SGKTTLLNLIGCIDIPTKGKVWINGKDTQTMSDDEISEFRNRFIGFVFQSFNLIPVLNLYENIEYPLLLGNQKVDKEWLHYLIERVGLKEFMKHKPDELSGGQRQRVAIARALSTKPVLVIADEPTANLDSETGESIVNLLLELNREKNITFIFSTHSEMIAKHAKKIIHILDGKIVD
ncbi:MAG: ABC transporter ATP-binding protein, partial [Brevinematia bacterium]